MQIIESLQIYSFIYCCATLDTIETSRSGRSGTSTNRTSNNFRSTPGIQVLIVWNETPCIFRFYPFRYISSC